MGLARRRPSGSRRRRGGPSAGGVAVRLTAAAAVGLVALSAPATELAARVTASAAPVRAAAPADPPAPATPADPVAPATVAPAPVAELPVTAPPPRRLQVELPTPVVPRGQPLQVTPPPAECGGYGNPRQVTPGVVPGAGSATVSWQADGRDDVRGYRVTAVSQALTPGGQPAPPRVDVAQRADCGEVSTVLGGLTPGVPYVFWLEEALLDADTQVVEYVQVGWSSPVVVG